MLLRFTKMHGLKNDFMVIDMVTQHALLSPRMIHQWSDRRTGIGFDKLLIAEPPGSPEADFRYRTFDAQGNEVEFCADGVRCFARFVQDKRLTAKAEILIETTTGLQLLQTRGGDQISISRPPSGGHLNIQSTAPDQPALLTGPAIRIYEGQIRV